MGDLIHDRRQKPLPWQGVSLQDRLPLAVRAAKPCITHPCAAGSRSSAGDGSPAPSAAARVPSWPPITCHRREPGRLERGPRRRPTRDRVRAIAQTGRPLALIVSGPVLPVAG